MARVRRKDTPPEMMVRRLLHAAGFRYRLHLTNLPGKPDIVLPRLRAAVFVHGCFWHGHTCRAGRRPSANADYWNAKIDKNMERDARCIEELQRLSWQVWVLWSCDLPRGVSALINDLSDINRERQSTR